MVAVVAMLGCTAPGAGPAAGYEQVDAPIAGDRADALQAVLDEAVRLSGSSGGVAGVWAPWSGEWTSAVGREGFEEDAAALDVDAGIRMATATTAITCTIMLRLADEGELDPDGPVHDLLSDMPGLEGITPAQLCQNTSGIPDYYPGLRSHFLGNPERVWSPVELVSNSLALEREAQPGQTWSYSRGGILLLSLALERSTHRSWNDLANQYVFAPLGLTRTRLPGQNEVSPDGVLRAYAAAGSSGKPDCEHRLDVSAQSPSVGGAAAGAVSTVSELHTMAQAFAAGSLLSEHSARTQWSAIPMGDDAPGWQSYGLGAAEFGPMRGVAGESPGALTAVLADPDSGLTVVIALNNSTSGASFVREAAFALASIGSKAEAAPERERPMIELPWSLEQAQEKMTELAKCPLPAPEAEPEAGDDAEAGEE